MEDPEIAGAAIAALSLVQGLIISLIEEHVLSQDQAKEIVDSILYATETRSQHENWMTPERQAALAAARNHLAIVLQTLGDAPFDES